MLKRFYVVSAGLILALCLIFYFVFPGQPLLVLDSGHNPSDGGAVSLNGKDEVVYNDHFVRKLKPALEQSGWKVVLTRTPEQEISLQDRAKLANDLNADLFLSIHHDSAKEIFLNRVKLGDTEQEVWETKYPIQGFSVLVSGENAEFEQSQKIAQAIGASVREYMQRQPAMHHAATPELGGHPMLDEENGVYQYDKLVVLRTTKMPAVLFEVGVIVDRADEAYVSNEINQNRMVEAIVKALKPFQ